MKAMVFSGRETVKMVWAVLIGLLLVAAMGIFVLSAVASGEGGRRLPIYSVETPEKQVAITLNCAWDDEDIPTLLALFKEKKVKATFFVLGQWAKKYPDSMRAIRQAGHEIGNHSNSHPDLTACSEQRIREELERADEKIAAATGEGTTLFRAPSGAYNNLVIETAAKLGYKTIQWDVDSIDWKNPTPEEMTRRVLGKTANGSIILFHSGAANTPEALPEIIDTLARQGYVFLTVSEMIYAKNYTIDNEGRQRSTVGY